MFAKESINNCRVGYCGKKRSRGVATGCEDDRILCPYQGKKKEEGRQSKERRMYSHSVVAKGFLYQSSLGLLGKALTEKKYFMI